MKKDPRYAHYREQVASCVARRAGAVRWYGEASQEFEVADINFREAKGHLLAAELGDILDGLPDNQRRKVVLTLNSRGVSDD